MVVVVVVVVVVVLLLLLLLVLVLALVLLLVLLALVLALLLLLFVLFLLSSLSLSRRRRQHRRLRHTFSLPVKLDVCLACLATCNAIQFTKLRSKPRCQLIIQTVPKKTSHSQGAFAVPREPTQEYWVDIDQQRLPPD